MDDRGARLKEHFGLKAAFGGRLAFHGTAEIRHLSLKYMKTITVKEMKANWAQIESQVKAGETFEVPNRGKVAVHIVPARPRQVLQWPDHLATAHRNEGTKGSDLIREQRDGRY